MKNARDPGEIDGLLNAVLADDDWHALNRSLKNEALAAISVARRSRRLLFRVGSAVCAVALLAGTGWWWLPQTPGYRPVITTSGQATSAQAGKQFISEEEMLAMFPAGSCVVAEVDGQRTLVFFDSKQAEKGYAWSSR